MDPVKKTKAGPHAFRVGAEVVVESGGWRCREHLARIERVTPGGLLAVSGEEKFYAVDAKGDRATERRALPSGRDGWGTTRRTIRPATDVDREAIERDKLAAEVFSAVSRNGGQDTAAKLPLDRLRQVAAWLREVHA